MAAVRSPPRGGIPIKQQKIKERTVRGRKDNKDGGERRLIEREKAKRREKRIRKRWGRVSE